MFKKILLLTVMAVVMVLEVPSMASAATAKNATLNAGLSKPQIQVRIGTRRNRRYRRDYDRDNDYRRETGRYVTVPQYYWMDGRRYVRYVQVYRNY